MLPRLLPLFHVQLPECGRISGQPKRGENETSDFIIGQFHPILSPFIFHLPFGAGCVHTGFMSFFSHIS